MAYKLSCFQNRIERYFEMDCPLIKKMNILPGLSKCLQFNYFLFLSTMQIKGEVLPKYLFFQNNEIKIQHQNVCKFLCNFIRPPSKKRLAGYKLCFK